MTQLFLNFFKIFEFVLFLFKFSISSSETFEKRLMLFIELLKLLTSFGFFSLYLFHSENQY